MDYRQITSAYYEQQIAHYKHLHAYPELSFEEYETNAYIKAELKKCGIEAVEGIHGTSVVAYIDGNEPGKTIAFRADIDALPIQEEVDIEYKSTVPNVMHACGHDSHCATLLTFAKLLSEHKELIKGRVKLIFQAAEEKLPGGAKGLCEVDHVMDDVDEIYGFHSAAGKPDGTVSCKVGASSGCIGVYEVTVFGKGGHGSRPDAAINVVPIACQLACSINQIRTEKIDPSEICVMTVAYMNGGQYPNIITDKITFGGNIRTMSNEVTATVFDYIKRYSESFCEMNGCICEVKTVVGYPATINTEPQIEVVKQAIGELGLTFEPGKGGLGGEDYAYYLMEKPGAYFSVGMSDPADADTAAPHHNSLFCLDLKGMSTALDMELAVYCIAAAR